MTTDDSGNTSEFDPDPVDETRSFDASPAVDDTAALDTETPVPVDETIPGAKDRPAPINARTELPFGLILFLVIAVLLVVFTVQNSSEDVTLKFLVWEGSYPLALIIIGVVAVTVVLDEVLGLFLRQRRRKRLAEKRELKRLREQNL